MSHEERAKQIRDQIRELMIELASIPQENPPSLPFKVTGGWEVSHGEGKTHIPFEMGMKPLVLVCSESREIQTLRHPDGSAYMLMPGRTEALFCMLGTSDPGGSAASSVR